MIYNLKNNEETKEALHQLNSLIEKECLIEIKEKRNKRTLSQNAYLHVLFTLYGVNFGYTIEESKTLLKRLCPFMRYEKNNTVFLKQTSKMDKKELTGFIEWLITYSSKEGLYLPTSEEYLEAQHHYNREIEKVKEFL